MCPNWKRTAISDGTAKKIVDRYATTGDICPNDLKTGRSRSSKVSFGDQMLIFIYFIYLKSSKQITMSHSTCKNCGC